MLSGERVLLAAITQMPAALRWLFCAVRRTLFTSFVMFFGVEAWFMQVIVSDYHYGVRYEYKMNCGGTPQRQQKKVNHGYYRAISF